MARFSAPPRTDNDENKAEQAEAEGKAEQAETQTVEQAEIREELEKSFEKHLTEATSLIESPTFDVERARELSVELTNFSLTPQLSREEQEKTGRAADELLLAIDYAEIEKGLGFDLDLLQAQIAGFTAETCSEFLKKLESPPDLETEAGREAFVAFRDAVEERRQALIAEATQRNEEAVTDSSANTGPIEPAPQTTGPNIDTDATDPDPVSPVPDSVVNSATATDPAAVTQTASTETRPDNRVGEHTVAPPWKAWLGAFVSRTAGSARTGLARARRRHGRKALFWAFCLAGIFGLYYGVFLGFTWLETVWDGDARTELSAGTPKPPTSTVTVEDEPSDEVPSPPEAPAESVSTEPIPASPEVPEVAAPPAEPASAEPAPIAEVSDEPVCVPYTETPRCATDRVLPTADDAPFRRPHWDCGRTELVMRDGTFDVCTPGCSYCYFPSSS